MEEERKLSRRWKWQKKRKIGKKGKTSQERGRRDFFLLHAEEMHESGDGAEERSTSSSCLFPSSCRDDGTNKR